MSRPRLPIVPHLPHEEIARRYRTCRDGVAKTHWQVLWLLTRPDDPLTPAQAASHVGLTPSWVRSLLKRYNSDGPEGLADHRATNGGHPKLSPEQQAELYAALQAPPPDGGLWTGPKVKDLVRQRWGVIVRTQTGWCWLRRLGFTLQVPRPRHPKALSPAEQQVWKRPHRWVDRRAAPAGPREADRALGRG
jgi:transposase